MSDVTSLVSVCLMLRLLFQCVCCSSMSDVTSVVPVCLMLRVDTAGVQYSHKQALVTVEGTKLKYMHMKEQVIWTSVD